MAAFPHYPNEPFAQAESLLTGLIDSYKSSVDAEELAGVQMMLDSAVKAAQDKEFRVQDTIKGLVQRVESTEAEAVYSEARAQHEQRVKEINSTVQGVQQEVQQLTDDVRGANDQQTSLQQRQKQLQNEQQELKALKDVVLPDMLERISMYAHITGLAFDYNTLDDPVTCASFTDAADGAIRNVQIDHSRPAFETANMLWDNLDTPQLQ